MATCEYGCGGEASYRLKNGKHCCSARIQSCRGVRTRIGERSGASRRGSSHSDDHRSRISLALTGRTVGPEIREKIRQGNVEHWSRNARTPWNKGIQTGQTPWNKGKRKREPIPVVPGDDPIYSNFKKYRNRVSARTRRTYRENKAEINPFDLPLGRCGVDGAYHIDHIISVRHGFENKIPVEVISAKENLQLLPWLDNIRKYDH